MVSEMCRQMLEQAVDLQSKRRYPESLICYQNGLQMLLATMKETQDATLKEELRKKASLIMDKAEHVKSLVVHQKSVGDFHAQILIAENSTGHSFDVLLAPYINNALSSIEIEDAYIRTVHQVDNLVRFLEAILRKTTLKRVSLLTTSSSDPAQHKEQCERLQLVSQNLESLDIHFAYSFSETLHDRVIRFNNGYIIKSGRGLDIYKKPISKFSIGFHDNYFRKCHQTTIDVYALKR